MYRWVRKGCYTHYHVSFGAISIAYLLSFLKSYQPNIQTKPHSAKAIAFHDTLKKQKSKNPISPSKKKFYLRIDKIGGVVVLRWRNRVGLKSAKKLPETIN